jgi:LmbE family N-acetylglucosaminyl deacetylase
LATFVFFHAHPDDEAIATGGTMIRASRNGHRVVLVIATGGEMGEPPELRGSALADIRAIETEEAAELLGVHRMEFLGYRDSGMDGDTANGHRAAFAATAVDDAAVRLAAVLEEESADVLTVYDNHGGYGHPDHIQVHRVGHRAAAMAGVDPVYEATMNRDRIRDLIESARANGDDIGGEDRDAMIEIGTPDVCITTAVEVTDVLDRKRAAMAAHTSQIGPDSWFLRLAPEAFTAAFGTEWFIRRPFDGDPIRDRETWLR